MLDLSIDEANLQKSFDRMASDLFNKFDLAAGDRLYRLTEIEFYYNKYGEDKIDNFAHFHGQSYPDGVWRLHGAGLDIVFKSETYYGGILLRGMQRIDDTEHKLTDGPWNLATTLVRRMGDVTNPSTFKLVERQKLREEVYKKSPRVGLFLTKKEDLEYICAPWRYVTWPTATKKWRHTIALQLHHDGDKAIEEIGVSKATIKKYIKGFEEGKTMEAQAFVNAKLNVAKTCQMFGKYVQLYRDLKED